jgi:hypothetical protein
MCGCTPAAAPLGRPVVRPRRPRMGEWRPGAGRMGEARSAMARGAYKGVPACHRAS